MPLPRIFFVNRVYQPSMAATAQLLTDLAEGLAARGWPVHVIATGKNSGDARGVQIHRTGPGENHRGLVSRFLNYRRFQRAAGKILAAQLQPDDVVVPMTDPPMLGAMVHRIAQTCGARVLPWIQDIYPEILTTHLGGHGAWFFRSLRARRDAAWHGAARCVILGEEMGSMLVDHGVAPNQIEVVPNWAPRELHEPAPQAAIAARREAWGVGKNFVVAYSGNLGRVHEFDAVVEAATILRDHRSILFLFIGTGARFEAVRTAAQKRGLENFRFLPPEPRAQLAASLAAADAHLVTLRPAFASLVFPSKLAGVLAAARPVLFVGRTDGGIARLLTRAGCGAVFSPGDAVGLANQITAWQSDLALRENLGRQARALYEEKFTFSTALTHWESLLSRIAPVK